MEDEIREAAWVVVSETGSAQAIAERARVRFGWKCSERAAASRVSQWWNPADPHQLPAEILPDIVEETGRDPFTPILLRAGMRKPPRRAVLEERRRAV